MQNTGVELTVLSGKYAAEIAEVKSRCQEGIENLPDKHAEWLSDLAILRHVLSNEGNIDKAEGTVKQALAWSRVARNARLLDAVNAGKPPAVHSQIVSHICTHLWTEGPMVNGAPVWIIRAGYGSPQQLMDEVDPEDLLEWLLYWRMLAMRQLDVLSTESGKLVKMIIVNDLRNCGLFQAREKRFFKVLGRSAEDVTFLCPHQQMKSVMMNPPSFMAVMFRFTRHVMPKKALDKIAVCPKDTFLEAIGGCPFAQVWWPVANVPDFMGGQYKLPEGHPLLVDMATPVEDGNEVVLKPKEVRTFDVMIPAGRAMAQLQLTCLSHKFAKNPGVEVSAVFSPLKEGDVTYFDTNAAQAQLNASDADSVATESCRLMPIEIVKTDAGRKRCEWPLTGPGVVEITVRNPSGGIPGTKKTVQYMLRAFGCDEKVATADG